MFGENTVMRPDKPSFFQALVFGQGRSYKTAGCANGSDSKGIRFIFALRIEPRTPTCGVYYILSSCPNLNHHTHSGQHIHQHINAELVDLASNQIADPRLRYSECCGCGALG